MKKKGGICEDCGFSGPPYCFHFDHRDPDDKTADIGYLIQRGPITDALEELVKCDLVCANCHAVRTFEKREAINRKIAEGCKRSWRESPRTRDPQHNRRISNSLRRAWNNRSDEERQVWSANIREGQLRYWNKRLKQKLLSRKKR